MANSSVGAVGPVAAANLSKWVSTCRFFHVCLVLSYRSTAAMEEGGAPQLGAKAMGDTASGNESLSSSPPHSPTLTTSDELGYDADSDVLVQRTLVYAEHRNWTLVLICSQPDHCLLPGVDLASE